MVTITVLKSIGLAFARIASRRHLKEEQKRLSGGDLQRPIQWNPSARNGSRQFRRFLIAIAALMLAPAFAWAQSSCYVWQIYTGATFATGASACAALAPLDAASVGDGRSYTVTSAEPSGIATALTGGVFCIGTVTWPNRPAVTNAGMGGAVTVPGACQVSPKDVGKTSNQDAVAGDPIVMSIGNKVQTDTDYQAPGPNGLQFVRVYNSASTAGVAANFATGWMHNYATFVNTLSTTSAAVTRPDGKEYLFNLVSGTWTTDTDVNDKLVQLLNGTTVIGWQYTNAADDSLETYDAHGNLTSIAYREGNMVTMTYVTGSGPPTSPGQLLSVTDSFGKALTFSYANGVLHSMTDPNGGVYTYALDPVYSMLSSVTYPDTFLESYLYNESAFTAGASLSTALTGVIDENNSRYTTTWYDTSGTAIRTALAGGAGQYSMTNTLDGTVRIQSVALLNPLGGAEGRTFVPSVGRNRLSTVTQPAASGSPAATKSYTYDANGNVAQVTDYNGNVECSAYDLTRNLETARIEGMASGSSCPSNIPAYVPSTGTVERKILTQWHAIWHLPAQRAEPLKITTWVYNGDGGVYCAPATAQVGINPIGVVCSRSEQATTDATGGAGFSATASGSPRVWAYTYNGFGQVLSVDGPRADVADITTYTYYSCTTGAQCGQINTISNALGQVTTFLTYNGNGQPLTISDPNGVVTTLTYDTRLRLTSRKIGSEITSYAYYPNGLLETVTLPDSSTITYTYDAAHRLTKITDGLGNHISYSLDAMGNRTADNSYDPAGTLRRTHSRVFNAVNKLYQDINAANTAAVTTTLGYDGNGNVATSNAPLARNTVNAYDALNRLSQITDPNGGVTLLAYDGRDGLAVVIDPRTLSTSYAKDGFGDVTQLVSPDTGTNSSTYDSGGNLRITTDARGALATYSYDALNRVTQVAYPDQTINFTYDAGSNGVGRLTGAADANHSLSWTYDGLGRVTGKGQVNGVIAQSVGYGYTNGDLVSMITPSGQTVVYGYTNHRIISVSVNGTTILSGVTYDPFGPANAWTWGNGTMVSRTYDQDGNPSQFITAGVTNGYTIDNASRITGISDSALSSNSWTFGYDPLDRVNSGTSSAITEGYTYDANSNRLTTTGAVPSAETIATTSNQLASATGSIARTYSYDAAGNTLGYGGNAYTFNQRGRMSAVLVGANETDYIYNALGQLIRKSGAGGTTLLMYDEAGHLLGEYDGTGALIQETIWMGDIPFATLQPNGSSVSIYYVHTGHLGTPRKITRPSDNGLMWRWDPDTFGTLNPNTNPSGLGVFNYNLRFPGQYYLAESGLHENYFRDFDPQTGRYIEPDPMGQLFFFMVSSTPGASLRHRGYWNHLYNYVDNDPVLLKDPTGLGRFDWLWDLFKEKSPEQITTKGLAAGFGAQCIAQNCGKARSPIDLFGDCTSILDAWIKKMGAGAIGVVNGINADGGQGVVSECAELCEKGISTGACCNGKKQ